MKGLCALQVFPLGHVSSHECKDQKHKRSQPPAQAEYGWQIQRGSKIFIGNVEGNTRL
jgi:hypothetical protein